MAVGPQICAERMDLGRISSGRPYFRQFLRQAQK